MVTLRSACRRRRLVLGAASVFSVLLWLGPWESVQARSDGQSSSRLEMGAPLGATGWRVLRYFARRGEEFLSLAPPNAKPNSELRLRLRSQTAGEECACPVEARCLITEWGPDAVPRPAAWEEVLREGLGLLGWSRDKLPWPAERCSRESPDAQAHWLSPLRDYGPQHRGVLGGLWAFVFLGGMFGWYGALRRWQPPLGVLLALGGLTLLAITLRTLLSPHTFMHEYYRGATDLLQLLSFEGFTYHGETGPTIYRMANWLLGLDEEAVFAANACLSALTVPALVLACYSLLRRWDVALFCGLLLCCSPFALRFAASEVQEIPATLCLVVAVGHLLLYLESRSWLSILTATAALSLAMQGRSEMMVFAPVTLATLGLAVLPWSDWRRLVGPPVLLGGLIAVAVCGPRVMQLVELLSTPGAPEPQLPSLAGVLRNTVFLKAEDGAVWPVVFLGLGGVWLLLRSWRLALWLLVVSGGYLCLSQSFYSNPVFDMRTQQAVLPFFLLVAAGAMAAVRLAVGRWPALVVAVSMATGLLPVADLLLRRDYVSASFDQQLEWEFQKSAVAALPAVGELLVTDGEGGSSAFPDFLLRREGKGLLLHSVRHAVQSDRWPAASGLLYYQGTYCFFSFDEPAPPKMRESCQAVWRRYRMRPLRTALLDVPNYSGLPSAARPFEIGYYEVLGERGAGGEVTPLAAATPPPPLAVDARSDFVRESSFPPGFDGVDRRWLALSVGVAALGIVFLRRRRGVGPR